MPTESAIHVLSILRDGNQFQWFVNPLLVFVYNLYTE